MANKNGSKDVSVGQILDRNATEMRLEKGDLFEIAASQVDEHEGTTTMALGCSNHGRVMVAAWRETSGQVPTETDLALLNAMGRALKPVMISLASIARDAIEAEILRDGVSVTGPLIEPFVACAVMAYVKETMPRRLAISESVPALQALQVSMMPVLMDLGTSYGRMSAQAAYGDRSAEQTGSEIGNNGGMVTVNAEEMGDPSSVRANMALAKALGMAAVGKTRGDA